MSQRKAGDDRLAVSELRFLRLLDARDIEALYDSLRRVLPLMDGRVDVLALTNDLLQWGEQVKKRWAYAYEWPARTSS
jgi:CRISPR system Cascade subunit CasB